MAGFYHRRKATANGSAYRQMRRTAVGNALRELTALPDRSGLTRSATIAVILGRRGVTKRVVLDTRATHDGAPIDTSPNGGHSECKVRAMGSEAHMLTIDGEVDRPVVLRFDELLLLPAVERRVQIVCASGEISDAVMRGVTLADVFDLARVRSTARLALFTCSDGYQERVSLADLIQREAFLAYWVGGEQVEEPGSLPRLSIPGKVGSRWAKGVRRIELF